VALAVTGPNATTARLPQHAHIRSRVSGKTDGGEVATGGLLRAWPGAYRPRGIAARAGSSVMGTRNWPDGLAARWAPMAGPDGRREL
jgi:hypothetical protein